MMLAGGAVTSPAEAGASTGTGRNGMVAGPAGVGCYDPSCAARNYARSPARAYRDDDGYRRGRGYFAYGARSNTAATADGGISDVRLDALSSGRGSGRAIRGCEAGFRFAADGSAGCERRATAPCLAALPGLRGIRLDMMSIAWGERSRTWVVRSPRLDTGRAPPGLPARSSLLAFAAPPGSHAGNPEEKQC